MPPIDDPIVRLLLELLSRRGIAALLCERADPIDDLHAECRAFVNEPGRRDEMDVYLDANPIITQSLRMMLGQLAMAAGVRPSDTAEVLQPLSAIGWHIGRWLPTFLVVGGPLRRVLTEGASPICSGLRTSHRKYPLLAACRDAFNHKFFKLVRNGFGHWSFIWEQTAVGVFIRIIEDDGREERLSLLEAEALHFLIYSVIRALDVEMFRSSSQLGDARN